MRLLQEMQEFGDAIRMNLLEKSGLADDRVLRDLNLLEDSINEASHHLNTDELSPALDRHFGLDNLKESDLNKQADGCTIAALLMMNAAMLHQRIANGQWLSGVSDLAAVKNDVNVVRRISREWNQIMRHDFRPVLEPAVNAIEAIEDTGKLAGLERALRHIAALRTADPNDPEVERFFRRIPEHGNRVLRVAVNTRVAPWRVVSVFFDRSMRGEL